MENEGLGPWDLITEAVDRTKLVERLRKRADQLKPEWATASDHWYGHGGRQQQIDAELLREAANALEKYTGYPPSGNMDGILRTALEHAASCNGLDPHSWVWDALEGKGPSKWWDATDEERRAADERVRIARERWGVYGGEDPSETPW